jgi:putative GTP pyrophosphokinase
MTKIDLTKAAYIFDGLTDKNLPDDVVAVINSLLITENLYLSATREITTKLENLNDEFKHTKDRNPIHQIKARVKTPTSIINKLSQRGLDLSVESARENLTDIAGVRVICSYIDDIYLIAHLLTSQDDIKVIRRSDYIKSPKQNGYRSLHLIVTVPVFLSETTEIVNVEVQIRTIAMDFWASLEHDLSYKLTEGKTDNLTKDLKDCADIISNIDLRMQSLYNITIPSKVTDKQ